MSHGITPERRVKNLHPVRGRKEKNLRLHKTLAEVIIMDDS